jgi:hypothetical protein
LYVSVADFPSFARNFTLTRCSTLHKSDGAQIHGPLQTRAATNGLGNGRADGRIRTCYMPPRSLLPRPLLVHVGAEISAVGAATDNGLEDREVWVRVP